LSVQYNCKLIPACKYSKRINENSP